MTYKLLKGEKLVLDTLMISQVNVCILNINALKWNRLIKTLDSFFLKKKNIFYMRIQTKMLLLCPSLKNILYFPQVGLFHFLTQFYHLSTFLPLIDF